MAFGAIAAAAAPLVAGFLGSERKNRVDQREAAKNRAFQAEQADANRAFQERMRNTEWQAGIADMEAAGVNPALAYSQGGASSPSGSMGSGSQAAPSENSVASAMQLQLQRRQLDLLKEQVRKTAGEADQTTAGGELAKDRASFLLRGTRPAKDGSLGVEYGSFRHRDLLQSEVGRAVAEAARAGSMAEISGIGGQVAQGMQDFMPAFKRVTRLSGQGMSQMTDVLDVVERAARMRDSAVRAWLGVPKAAVLMLRKQLQKARN